MEEVIDGDVSCQGEGHRKDEISTEVGGGQRMNEMDRFIPIEEPGKPVQCQFCGREFTKVKFLKLHIKTHASDRYTCQYCGRVFTHNGGYQRHLLTHTARKSFECTSHCGQSFSDNESLQRHLQEKHGVILPVRLGAPPTKQSKYACSVCALECASRGDLQKHVKSHQLGFVRPHQCTVCSSSFINRGNLTAHMKVHTGERPYLCSCGKGFANLGLLKIHAKNHPNELRRFTCLYCKTHFTDENELHSHVKISHVIEQKIISMDTLIDADSSHGNNSNNDVFVKSEEQVAVSAIADMPDNDVDSDQPIRLMFSPATHRNHEVGMLGLVGKETTACNQGLYVVSGSSSDGRIVVLSSPPDVSRSDAPVVTTAAAAAVVAAVVKSMPDSTLRHIDSVMQSVLETDDDKRVNEDVNLQSTGTMTSSPTILSIETSGGDKLSNDASSFTGEMPLLEQVLPQQDECCVLDDSTIDKQECCLDTQTMSAIHDKETDSKSNDGYSIETMSFETSNVEDCYNKTMETNEHMSEYTKSHSVINKNIETPSGVEEAPSGVEEAPSGVGEAPSGVGEAPSGVGEAPSGDVMLSGVGETPSGDVMLSGTGC